MGLQKINQVCDIIFAVNKEIETGYDNYRYFWIYYSIEYMMIYKP